MHLLIEGLTILLLSMHLICMNVAAAGPLVCIWLDSRAARQSVDARRAACFLAWNALQLSVSGAVFGLVIGWLRWIEWGHLYVAGLRLFESRLRWGVAEFLFSVALIAGYSLWITRRPQVGMAERWVRSFVALLSSTNLLYHFPPLFALIGRASNGGEYELTKVDSAMFRKLIMGGEIPAISLHFFLASFAAAGALLMYLNWRTAKIEGKNWDRGAWGGRIALVASLLQIPVGIWLIMTLPAEAQHRLMGGDLLLSSLFILSLVLVMVLLHQLASVAFGDNSRRALGRAMLTMLAVIVVMTAVLRVQYWVY